MLRRERRGYWTAALGVVLEKHGVLGVRTCRPDELAASLRGREPLIVGRLLPAVWTDDLTKLILDAGAPAFFEAPLPPVLQRTLGVRVTGSVPHTGRLTATDAELDRAVRQFGFPAGGSLEPTVVRTVDRLPELDWGRMPDVPIAASQADAWRARSWDVEGWAVGPGVSVLAEWRSQESAAKPAIVSRGSLFAASYGMLSALAQAHTSEPYDGPEVRISPRTIGHEALLLAILDRLHDVAEIGSARILPWPAGARWALNVRHDVDRPLHPRGASRCLELHDRLGTRATWYWRAGHLGGQAGLRAAAGWLRTRRNRKALTQVGANPRHEVALHTERIWDGTDKERALLERFLGTPIAGASAHGAPDCFRYQGAPNILWADELGLSYTELIQRAHLHPHRFPALEADGRIVVRSVICLPHHESLDRSMAADSANVERLEAMQPVFERASGLLQVMNHPDLNQRELFDLLGRFPREGRLDLTAAQAADWWRRTHTPQGLRAEREGAHAWRITARHAVRRLQVELRRPGGALVARVLDLDPEQPALVT